MFYGLKNDEPPLPFFPEFCVKSARRIAESYAAGCARKCVFRSIFAAKAADVAKKDRFHVQYRQIVNVLFVQHYVLKNYE